MDLRLEQLSKRYADTVAVDAVSLTLGRGETLALLGPSGCGKSTLLRLVAGLERPDRGRLLLGNHDATAWAPQRRRIGMVFQDYALFPHLDVERNVAFGLVEQRLPASTWRPRVAALLERVGLAGFEGRRIHQLSGGQQQRVALARALAPEPGVLLLDEPLSNLDQTLRESLKLELRELLSSLEVLAIYVTHDQGEAFTVAERVALMRRGRIEVEGDRDEVLERPSTVWAARFLGYRNVFDPAPMGVPGAPDGGAALLRDDLIAVGGALETRIIAARRNGLGWELELRAAAWGIDIVWSGFARELPTAPQVGNMLNLTVPTEAWLPLVGSRGRYCWRRAPCVSTTPSVGSQPRRSW
jgi:ABC-type Fe3+/spermidine/putrescine transport system ATPase subunit